jgi:uncharacterized protein YjgD (DUF1641 family)
MVEATMEQTKLESSAGPNNNKLDVLEQLLKPEAQEALITLAEQLPKLAEMTTLLTKTYELASQVAADRVLIQDMAGGVLEMVKPLEEKVKGFASAMIEASERADQNQEPMGMFDLLKMLKDPELQHMLRFGQAYLDITRERKQG